MTPGRAGIKLGHMADRLPLDSPLFWFMAAVAVALLLTFVLFRTDLQLYWRLRAFARRAGDIRVPAGSLRGAAGPVRTLAARALALPVAGRQLDAARLFDRAAEQATGEAKAELFNLAGVCYYLAGRFEAAAERYRGAAAQAEAAGAKPLQAAAWANLGLAQLVRNEPEHAHTALEQALALDRETGDQAAVAAGLSRLGLTWHARNEPARALDLYNEALALNRATGNRRGAACDLGRIGLSWQVLGEHERAFEHYRESYATARKAGDEVAAAEVIGNTGLLQLKLGEDEKALASLLGSLALFGRMRDTTRALNTVLGLRMVLERMGAEAFAAGCRRFGVDSRDLARTKPCDCLPSRFVATNLKIRAFSKGKTARAKVLSRSNS